MDKAGQIHPDLYFKVSKQEFLKQIKILENSINDSISVDDFSRKMNVLINLLGDAHTNVFFSDNLWEKYENSANRLPFKIKIKSGKIFIKSSDSKDLFEKDEVLSINGIKTNELLKLVKYTTFEVSSFKENEIEKYFSFYLFMGYEFEDKISVKIKRNDIIFLKEVELHKRDKQNVYNKYSFKQINDTLSVLTMNSFAGINKKKLL